MKRLLQNALKVEWYNDAGAIVTFTVSWAGIFMLVGAALFLVGLCAVLSEK